MSATTYERKAIEFYTIQLSQLADGTVFVEITATAVDDQAPQLLSQEIATERATSLQDALETIRRNVLATVT